MSYANFSYWYDLFNGAADYDHLSKKLLFLLKKHGVPPRGEEPVADLGCGTGEVCLRLARAGYDMIAVDASAEMLSILQEKLDQEGRKDILLLCQKLEELDLYGTIHAAVSTFDTLNHLPPQKLQEAIRRTALFLRPGGIFLFDANTPYKHEVVLGNKSFYLVAGDNGLLREMPVMAATDNAAAPWEEAVQEGIYCVWQNRYEAMAQATKMNLTVYENGVLAAKECFWEYAYPLQFWKEILHDHGFTLLQVQDGERFKKLRADSQRFLFVAQKL